MSVSSISSNSQPLVSSQTSGTGMQDLSDLIDALKSGDVDSAKTAVAALQQDAQDIQNQVTPNMPPYLQARPVNDLERLKQALDSGNIREALKAAHLFKQDMRQLSRHYNMYQYYRHGEQPGVTGPETDPSTEQTSSTGTNVSLTA